MTPEITLAGQRVPASLIRDGWSVQVIHEHPNSEVRRAAIERMGWLAYLDEAGLRLVASAPDPGNTPHTLSLYEDPDGRLGDARVLVMTSGSPERSGAALRYAETVPASFDDPVAALPGSTTARSTYTDPCTAVPEGTACIRTRARWLCPA